MPRPIRSVLVLGGGSAGFLAAITLRTRLPELNVTLIRSKSIPVIGVGEATLAWFPDYLHNVLGLDRKRFYSEVRIEYAFDLAEGVYRHRVVANEGRLLGRQNVYTLQSPLIGTERRARAAAKLTIEKLNRELPDPKNTARRLAQFGRSTRQQLVAEGWPIPD